MGQGGTAEQPRRRRGARQPVPSGAAARRPRRVRAPLGTDERGVTPVIGSIMVLAITVLGIAGVMLWGAPTIQRIQDRNAQVGMIGEFDDIRLSALALSVPDASRTPTLVMQEGRLFIQDGTTYMVTVSHDAGGAYEACDFHVTGWSTGAVDVFAASGTGCRTIRVGTECDTLDATQACLEVHEVSGSNLIEKTVARSGADYQVAGEDLTDGNWLFRLTNDEVTSLEVYAESFLVRSHMHSWRLESPIDAREVHQDGGAVFSRGGGTWFLESDVPFQEDAFGSGDYVLWLRTFSAISENAIEGRGSVSIFLGLVGSYTRVSVDDALRVRYDFDGELAEPWCRALLARNDDLTGDPYAEATSCTDDVPSVVYTRDAGATAFTFEFLHANVRTSLLV